MGAEYTIHPNALFLFFILLPFFIYYFNSKIKNRNKNEEGIDGMFDRVRRYKKPKNDFDPDTYTPSSLFDGYEKEDE